MIAFLAGKVLNKGKGYFIVRTGDIGYKVFVNSTIFANFDIGQKIEFYIYQHVKEDALDLYGFKSLEELEIYRLLLSVSGIGPKSALGVLSAASVDDLKHSIAKGDYLILTKVSGIGRKTAERVVLELREKIGSLSDDSKNNTESRNATAQADEIDALIALGYSLSQSREVLQMINPEIKDSSDRIKAALKELGK